MTYIEEEYPLIYSFNETYKEKGFKGIIDKMEDLLQYGEITQEQEQLWRITTGGFSEDEQLLHQLVCILSDFSRNHYVGYLRGGAYYFHEENCFSCDILQTNNNLETMYGIYDKTRETVLSYHYTLCDAEIQLQNYTRKEEMQINEYDVLINFTRLQKRNVRSKYK